MNFPTASQYVEAIQFPEVNLGGRDLPKYVPDWGGRSQPLSWNGSYAVVFRLKKPRGTKLLALRCITKKVLNLQERYEAYSAFLPKAPERLRKALVNARYQGEGIRLRPDASAEWCPVVVMDWVDAPELHVWVETHHRRASRLCGLQSRFRELAQDMAAAHFVHGDLQHRNILVKGDHPILVDYDSIQVPGPRPLPLTTAGIPSFRHPLQDGCTTGEAIDRFAFLVLNLALETLIQQPGLFDEFGKVEGLLFTGKDFREPGSSDLFTRLKALPAVSGRPALPTMAEAFIQVCRQPASLVPTLEDFLAPLEVGRALTGSSISAGPLPSDPGLPPLDSKSIDVFGRLYGSKPTGSAARPARKQDRPKQKLPPGPAPPPASLKPAPAGGVAAGPVAQFQPLPVRQAPPSPVPVAIPIPPPFLAPRPFPVPVPPPISVPAPRPVAAPARRPTPAPAPRATPTKAPLMPPPVFLHAQASALTMASTVFQMVLSSLRGRSARLLAVWGVVLTLCLGVALMSRDSWGLNLEGPLGSIRHDLVRIMNTRHADLQAVIVAMDEQIDMLRELPDDVPLVSLVLSDGTPRVESVSERRLDLVTTREKARLALLQCETVPEAFDDILRDTKLNPRQKLERLQRLAGLPPAVLEALLRLSEEGLRQ